MVQQSSIQLTDKELFLLGSLLELEVIVGLSDPFLGHLVEEIEEEWQVIKKELIEKKIIMIEDGSISISEQALELVVACGSKEMVQLYQSSKVEQEQEIFIYINGSEIVEKKVISSDPITFELSKITHEDARNIIQSIFQVTDAVPTDNTTAEMKDNIRIQLSENVFQEARELASQNDTNSLEELLQKQHGADRLIDTLLHLTSEAQLTHMKWNGNEWVVNSAGVMKAENHCWSIQFLEDRLVFTCQNNELSHQQIDETMNKLFPVGINA